MKLLADIKHLVSSPLTHKDKSYYTALSKQSHSYNELLFIYVKVIFYKVQAEDKSAHKPPPIVIQNHTIRGITQLSEPYKRSPSDSPITTFTHLINCYDRTHKFLQSLNLDSTYHTIITNKTICS